MIAPDAVVVDTSGLAVRGRRRESDGDYRRVDGAVTAAEAEALAA